MKLNVESAKKWHNINRRSKSKIVKRKKVLKMDQKISIVLTVIRIFYFFGTKVGFLFEEC
jgi:hypothetical protein